jgi:hypothetical protein
LALGSTSCTPDCSDRSILPSQANVRFYELIQHVTSYRSTRKFCFAGTGCHQASSCDQSMLVKQRAISLHWLHTAFATSHDVNAHCGALSPLILFLHDLRFNVFFLNFPFLSLLHFVIFDAYGHRFDNLMLNLLILMALTSYAIIQFIVSC